MIGLIAKDFLVFKKRFSLVYRLIAVLLLCGTVILFPNNGIRYIALMLPMMGVAFLTEIIKVEEKSDWKAYLPILPITGREIVLSRYIFCGSILVGFSVISFAMCVVASVIGSFALGTVMPDYIIGVWFAILMVCFGIPGGYFFKNDLCTGAMIGSLIIVGIIRNTGADALFFSLSSSLSIIVALFSTLVMVYISYKVSLWIFTVKRHQGSKLRISHS